MSWRTGMSGRGFGGSGRRAVAVVAGEAPHAEGGWAEVEPRDRETLATSIVYGEVDDGGKNVCVHAGIVVQSEKCGKQCSRVRVAYLKDALRVECRKVSGCAE
jgi:hypothetical protein